MPAAMALLELELRLISGVVFVAIDAAVDGDAPAVIEIAAPGVPDPGSLRPRAEQICRARLGRPVRVLIHSARRPSRVRLVGVNVVTAEDPRGEVVVVVDYQGRMAQGSGQAGDPRGPAAATVRALQRLGATVPFEVKAAALFEHQQDGGVMLVLDAPGQGERYGVASGATTEAAAARATLNALNRYLATQIMGPAPA